MRTRRRKRRKIGEWKRNKVGYKSKKKDKEKKEERGKYDRLRLLYTHRGSAHPSSLHSFFFCLAYIPDSKK